MEDLQPVAWVAFEDEVFKRVKRWLKSGSLCLSGINAEAYRKRSYYSEQRKAHIEFEVSIEAFDKGAAEPSLVWVWECKDNSASGRDVEVKDVEVLCSKIDQLGRSRFKASLVTTHGFQSGALELAKSNGIALFVLQKRMERVTKYARNAVSELVEKMIVTNGITWAGSDIEENEWIEHALSYCLMQYRKEQLPVDEPPGDE